MTQDITSLIEKLEGAEVGSRELDVAIWAHLHPEKLKVAEFWPAYATLSLTTVAFTLPPKRTRIVTRDKGEYVHAQPVTTSLNAALSLAERVLPRWAWSAGQGDGEKAYARLDTPDGCDFEEAYAATPALALCAALLRAQSEAR